MVVVMLTVGVGCAKKTDGDTAMVNEGLLYNEITLPATFFSESSEEDIKKASEEAGYKSYRINEDGSVTYKMSKKMHRELLDDFKTNIDEQIDKMVNGGEDAQIEGISEIKYNKDFSEIKIYMEKDSFNILTSFYALSFYMQGSYYQLFSGAKSDDVDVVVQFIDNESGEIIDSGSYQDWQKGLESSGSSK